MNALFRPLLLQSFKSSGIYLLIIALVLAISATTALKFSNDQIKQAVALQAAEMLGADLVIQDNYPIDNSWQSKAENQGLKTTNVTVFGSMAFTNDQFAMVNVKAIENEFPLRGELRIKPESKAIRSGEIWLSKRAQDLLNLRLGDSLNIADAKLKVTGIIEHDTNQELGFSGFSPTVIISQEDIAKTNAIQTGSRIEYRLLLMGDANKIQAFEKRVKNILRIDDQDAETLGSQAENQNTIRIRNASESNTRLMKPIANLDTFLQLANILTILLCGIAIALTSQRYVKQNQDHIALMRCLGARKAQILISYICLLVFVLFISIVIGCIVGVALGYGLLELMLKLIPHIELQFSAWSMLAGPLPIAIFTSGIVLFSFILPSLFQLLTTPPIRVIRQQEKSVKSMLWMFLTGILGLILFSVVLTKSITLTAWVLGGIILLSTILYTVLWVLLKFLKQLKQPISAYVRVPYQTALQITALALGLSLITVLMVLRTDLLERWQQQLPSHTPNQFVYGLPPFELPEFRSKISEYHWESTPLYPNIRGRLVAKNDQPFSKELIQNNNSLRRELNLTQSDIYPKDNIIVSGESEFTDISQVSVEDKTAKELGIHVGDRLTFTLPEGVLEAKVINLRSVEWESFSPNFFFIFSPNSMDINAGSYLGSFYVPQQDKAKLIKLIQQFSNTVFIDVSLILDEVKRVVQVLVQIISLLAFLVCISGILVLIACLNLMMEERKKEVALLRSFGSSKQNIKNMMMFEIGFMGLCSGLIACLFAEMISAIASYKMQLAVQLHWEIWLILPLLMTMICACIGRYRLGYLTDISPLKTLREMSDS